MNHCDCDNRSFYAFCQSFFGFEGGNELGEIRLRAVAERPDLLTSTVNSDNDSGDFVASCSDNSSNDSRTHSVLKNNKIIKIIEKDSAVAFEKAAKLNALGYAIYYLPAVYKTGEWKEDYKNIEGYRGVVVDFDGRGDKGITQLIKEAHEMGLALPWGVVESSEGHYQIIFKFDRIVSKEELGVDEFNNIAFGLACLLNGDFNAARATQPFRMPGFFWQKNGNGDGKFLSSVVYQSNSEGLKLEEIRDFFKLPHVKKIVDAGGTDSSSLSGTRGIGQSGIKIDLPSVRVGEISVGAGDRHMVLIRLATEMAHEGKSEEEIGEELGKVVRESFIGCGAEDFLKGGRRWSEVQKAIRDGLEYKRQKDLESVSPDKLGNIAAKQGIESASLPHSNDSSADENSQVTVGSPPSEPFEKVFEEYTEVGVSKRLIRELGDKILRLEDDRVIMFCDAEKVWKTQTDSSGQGIELQSKLVKLINEMIVDPKMKAICINDRGAYSFGAKNRKVSSMLSGSFNRRCERLVLGSNSVTKAVSSEFDDKDSWLFLSDGVLDMGRPLDSEWLGAAKAEHKLLKSCNVNRNMLVGNAGEGCPQWLKFLGEVFEDNGEMIDFMQELFGYSLSGSISEQKVFCHIGDGCNGKSKVLLALREVAGGYGTIIEPGELVAKKGGGWGGSGSGIERISVKTEGHRVAVIDDMDVGGVWNEGIVKLLTGRELRARNLYNESRVIKNRVKFHMGLNVAPEPEAENKGLIRRLCIIPYKVTFEENGDKENELTEMIQREKGGILRWAIEGYRRYWSRRKLVYPEVTKIASEEYKEENFSVENAIGNIFNIGLSRKASVEGELGAEWFSAGEVQEVVNSYLDGVGAGDKRLNSPRVISIQLKRVRIEGEVRWDGVGSKKMFLLVPKKKIERKKTGIEAL